METAGESRQLTWREVVGKSAAFLASKGVPDSAVAAELLAARKVGPWTGVIVGLNPKGLIVELPDTLQQGMLPYAALGKERYYVADDLCSARGKAGGSPYRLGQKVEVILAAVDERLQLVERQPDAVIRDAALGEIVRPYLRRAVAGTDHRSARLRLGVVRAGGIELVKAALQNAHRLFAVLDLAPFVLALHHYACGDMRDPYRGRGLVDVLPACARGTVGIDPDVVRVDDDVDVLRLGKHGDGRGAGVYAPLRFCLGHTLYAVHAAFEFHAGIGVFAVYLEDGFLYAAYLGIVHVDHFELKIMPLGVP